METSVRRDLIKYLAEIYVAQALPGTNAEPQMYEEYIARSFSDPNQFSEILAVLDDKNMEATISASKLAILLKESFELEEKIRLLKSSDEEVISFLVLLDSVRNKFNDPRVKRVDDRRKNALKVLGFSGATKQEQVAYRWVHDYRLFVEGRVFNENKDGYLPAMKKTDALSAVAKKYGSSPAAMHKSLYREVKRQKERGVIFPKNFLPQNPDNT
ncbi:MAG: hypothetical protein CMK32_07155 [Porticoccaceae bacterium]|nr:hypothetical protein [Porticoccaceae bacterium]